MAPRKRVAAGLDYQELHRALGFWANAVSDLFGKAESRQTAAIENVKTRLATVSLGI
jgi:hypothetical protein